MGPGYILQSKERRDKKPSSGRNAMENGPEEHLEHAEHAKHAARDPFDKRVTVTIAIVAAVLAGVTMAGHKAHNETLLLSGEAIKEQTQVGIFRTDAANKYSYYQAKMNLAVVYDNFLKLVEMLPLKPGSEKIHDEATTKWKSNVEKYDKKFPSMLKEAEEITAKAKEAQDSADKAIRDSHNIHAKADRYDLAELGLQLGVVMCSLAILTKSRNYWIGGILISIIGLLVAVSAALGMFMAEGH
jgi:hypothetical protein